MKYLSSFNILIIALLTIYCTSTNHFSEDTETLVAKAKLIEADGDFSIDFFKAVHANDSSENIFISPLSLSMALGMTLNGATGNTQYEMQNTLGFSDISQEEINKGYQSLKRQLLNADDKIQFEVANSVWARAPYSMKEEFKKIVEEYFDAETASLDFDDPKTLDTINNWVSNATNDKIKKILTSIESQDLMFLINAIYFKGSWTSKFDPDLTAPNPFYLSENNVIQIDMMKQLQEVNVLIDDEVTMLELPYGNETFSAIFIKPSRKDISIDQIISNKLTSEQLNNWITRLSKKKVEYFIPKFELEYKRELKEDLKALGMNQVFAHKAELNNLFNDLDNLYVSSVLQKTFLKMDEQGAEAAAATSITVGRTSMPSYEEVKIDQPYLLIMREKTSGAILFMGKITIPNG